jgi:predicted phosphate transport protein (TIGR00153 family)
VLRNLIPKEGKFFDFFRQSAEQSVKAAHAFRAMLDDLPNAERHAREIKAIEHAGDEILHRTVELLHKTFITPLDRDDIHRLISRMDDVLDRLDGATSRVHLYEMTEATPECRELADICVRACECIKRAADRLHDLTYTSGIIQECVEINRLENEADAVLARAKAKLFHEEIDTRQLIKLKEIYEFLEAVTDKCEDVANVIESIVLEYA